MSKTKHTPGDWYIKNGLIESTRLRRLPDGSTIGCSICKLNMNLPEAEANGRLIVALPDLLEVCRRTAGHFQDTDASLGEAARAAIAKTEGSDV